MRTRTPDATSIHKVRRDVRGGKRGDGHHRSKRIRRADPTRIHAGQDDATLTGAAGLASFGVFCRRKGVDAELERRFRRLKSGAGVVYPMGAQLRLLLDANVAGEARVFGLESLAADPLFVRLAGGVVPSLDTVYRDLCRFDDETLAELESLMVEHGLGRIRDVESKHVHLDVDTTVECLFGSQEGAVAGPNPRYHARPSYHPILVCCAELGTCVGALLRPGNTGLGDADAPTIGRWLRRFRIAAGGDVQVTMRIDAGGDCAGIYAAAQRAGARFIGKAKLSADLSGAIQATKKWTTTERDAFGRPCTQVAQISFARETWMELGYPFRVVAMRTRERDNGKQVQLWGELDYTVQAFVTNDWTTAAEEIAFEYDGRAEIEPTIGELKSGWGIGKVPSQDFHANHAVFLLKLLAHNLMRHFVRWTAPHLSSWRVPWLRRALINIPGRLLRSGRCWTLRLPPKSSLRLD
jgi:hypothetical protein